MNGRAIPGAYLFRLYVCDKEMSWPHHIGETHQPDWVVYLPTGNHVSANEDFGQRIWFRNELSSLAEVSLCTNLCLTYRCDRAKAWVCGSPHAGFVGSNPARRHGCPSLVTVVCCHVEVSAYGWSLIQRSPTECGVSQCVRKASTLRTSWPTRGCCANGGTLIRAFPHREHSDFHEKDPTVNSTAVFST